MHHVTVTGTVQLTLAYTELVTAPPWQGMSGARVVVIGPGGDVIGAAREAARRATGAVLLITTGEADLRAAVAESLLPPPRVLGVDASDCGAAVEAVLFDRPTVLTVAVVRGAELVRVSARVAGGGAQELLRGSP